MVALSLKRRNAELDEWRNPFSLAQPQYLEKFRTTLNGRRKLPALDTLKLVTLMRYMVITFKSAKGLPQLPHSLCSPSNFLKMAERHIYSWNSRIRR